MHVTQGLHKALQRSPERVFTVCGDRRRTVAQSVDRISRVAGALKNLGVSDGDRVAIIALNSDRYHESLFAIPWAGAAVSPVNTRWSAAEMAYSLRDCGCEVAFVDDAFLPMLPELRNQAPGLRTVIYCGDGAAPEGTVGYEDLVAATEPVPDALRSGDDLYGVFYTGGTTGNPKGVMLSHTNMVTSAIGSIATTPMLSRDGLLLHVAPMFHLADIAAWMATNLLGGSHTFLPAFNPADVVQSIAENGVTDLLLVPTMIQILIDSPAAAEADLSSIKALMYGASSISEAVLSRAQTVFPNARFTQAYGMTEAAPVVTLLDGDDHGDPALLRSCGRAVMHSEVRIMGPDGEEAERGTFGEICVRGDNVMLGYWNLPEVTAETVRDGWLHTGDGGRMDENGYVFMMDRIKDMIITGGENVYSAEVENALAKHPDVAQVAVIGLPDEQWGERVHAVVVARPGSTPDGADMIGFARELIAGYKVPRTVAFVDALPISGAGKILKRELRTMFQKSPAPSRTPR